MIHINGELHSSKNSRQIVRTGKKVRVVKSDASKADEGSFAVQLYEQREEWERLLSQYPGVSNELPIRVFFKIRRATKRKFDYINIVQGLCDSMVKAGYLVDDDADHLLPVFSPYKVDAHNPGCDFWIV